jgi:hypothetical protein
MRRKKTTFVAGTSRARKYNPAVTKTWMAGKLQSRDGDLENFRMWKTKRTMEAAKVSNTNISRIKTGINAGLAGINSKNCDPRANAAARARTSFLDI